MFGIWILAVNLTGENLNLSIFLTVPCRVLESRGGLNRSLDTDVLINKTGMMNVMLLGSESPWLKLLLDLIQF